MIYLGEACQAGRGQSSRPSAGIRWLLIGKALWMVSKGSDELDPYAKRGRWRRSMVLTANPMMTRHLQHSYGIFILLLVESLRYQNIGGRNLVSSVQDSDCATCDGRGGFVVG